MVGQRAAGGRTQDSRADDGAVDLLLAGYAAGRLSLPLQVLVASHLELSPRSRAYVAGLERMLAGEVEAAPPTSIARRDARLAAIFAEKPVAHPAAADERHGILPRPLAAYLDRPFEDLRWRRLMPGIREYRVERGPECEAVLYWIRGGREMPSHTHEGLEATLVISGGFTDQQGHYARGDIAVADDDIDHRPVTDADEDCVCYAVTEGNLRLTGPVGRILARLFRH